MKRIAQYTGWLRQVRLLHWLNNLYCRRRLAANKAIYGQLGIRRSVLRSIDSRVIRRFLDITDPGLIDKLPVRQSEMPPLPTAINWHRALQQWARDGFIQLNRYFSEEQVSAVNQAIGSALDEDRIHYNYTGRKIFNAHNELPSVAGIAKDPGLMAILHHLFGRPARHFQTINFLKGSEQAAHSDSIHMTTMPLGYLAGIWVALEDVDETNGPLTYYPASHRLPYLLNAGYGNSSNAFLLDGNANRKYEEKVAAIIADSGLERKTLEAKAGDVFIWHANLLHGGAPITDPSRTRKSMVSHYFADGVLCFHEISERPAILQE